jgi:hypothetical protein
MSIVDPPLLPGNIPGLLRPGSPIWWRGGETGIVYRLGRHEDIYFAADDTLHHKDLDSCVQHTGLSLRLDDITGRTHANWWIGKRNNGPDSKSLWMSVRLEIEEEGLKSPHRDDRLLPDGSSWIQAEIQRRVVLKLAEREYPKDIPLYRDRRKEALDRVKALIPTWELAADEYEEDGDARLCTLDCITELKGAISGR